MKQQEYFKGVRPSRHESSWVKYPRHTIQREQELNSWYAEREAFRRAEWEKHNKSWWRRWFT